MVKLLLGLVTFLEVENPWFFWGSRDFPWGPPAVELTYQEANHAPVQRGGRSCGKYSTPSFYFDFKTLTGFDRTLPYKNIYFWNSRGLRGKGESSPFSESLILPFGVILYLFEKYSMRVAAAQLLHSILSRGARLFSELKWLDSSAERDLYLRKPSRLWDFEALEEDLVIERKRKIDQDKLEALPSPFPLTSDFRLHPTRSDRGKKSSQRKPPKIVKGSTVEVYWNGDDAWYPAKVVEVVENPVLNRTQVIVKYPDNDQRHTRLDIRDINLPISSDESHLVWRIPSKSGKSIEISPTSSDNENRNSNWGGQQPEKRRSKKSSRKKQQPEDFISPELRRVVRELRERQGVQVEVSNTMQSFEARFQSEILGRRDVKVRWTNRDVELPALMTVLSKPCVAGKLRSISMPGHNIGSKWNRLEGPGAERLAEVLSKPSLRALESLDLSDNVIGDRGVVRILTALKTHPSIKHLALGRNHVSDVSAAHLAGLIKKSPSLKSLDLTWNSFTNDGALILQKALEEKPDHNMTAITLTDNFVKKNAMIAITKLLKPSESPAKKRTGRMFTKKKHATSRSERPEIAAGMGPRQKMTTKTKKILQEVNSILKPVEDFISIPRILEGHVRRDKKYTFACQISHYWGQIIKRIRDVARSGLFLNIEQAVSHIRTAVDWLISDESQNILKKFSKRVFQVIESTIESEGLGKRREMPFLLPLKFKFSNVETLLRGIEGRTSKGFMTAKMLRSLARKPFSRQPLQKA
ncbi:hypothetical protein AAMO2058_001329700, partial [Amorphochlora amoebiformis]